MNIEHSEILRVGLPLIKRWEGLKLKPYLCSANVPTIGYGSTFYLDGRKVSLGDPPITKDQAEALLVNTVNKIFLPAVLQLCPTLDSANKIAAILSFTYNLGVGALKSSTLRRRILARQWDLVPAELKKWNIAGGKVSNGLNNRRAMEISTFISNT